MERQSPKSKFFAFLREKQLKITQTREKIVEEIFKIHRHIEIEELVDICRKKQLKVSRATIYRTIELLLEAGLISKIPIKDGNPRYEHVHGNNQHYHIICTICGKIVEFQSKEIEELQDQICSKHGFKKTSHSFTIYGECADCRNFQRDSN